MATFEMFNRFPQLAEKFPREVSEIVGKTAFDIQAIAVQEAPVITGNLKNSIYLKRKGLNGYPGKADTSLLEDQVPEVEDPFTAYIAVAASYGIYVEMGHHGNPGKPYLGPAVEIMRPLFELAMSKLESRLQGL
jgi:hypothetical protein